MRIVKPGKGTLAALRHVCPHCASAQGVRCVLPSGEPRDYVHSKRMGLARAARGVKGRALPPMPWAADPMPDDSIPLAQPRTAGVKGNEHD